MVEAQRFHQGVPLRIGMECRPGTLMQMGLRRKHVRAKSPLEDLLLC